MNLHSDFPVVEGRYRLTGEWELELPGKFNRRIEDGNMVIWRPGLTFWIAVWGAETGKTPEETLAWILEDASPARTGERLERSDNLIRLSYRLQEEDTERRSTKYVSISGYVIAPSGHLQISAYCDDPVSEGTGEEVIDSVRWLV
jgi:hypothetical protein